MQLKMKKITAFVYLLLTTLIVSAQSPLTSYTGTIKGYNSNMGFKTGQVIINNVITGLHDSYLITIQADGNFSASFPLSHTQECWISLPFFNSTVYFEPGKKIIHNFDISDTRQVSHTFKGDCAAINNEINYLRPIIMNFGWEGMDNDIYELTPAEYKSRFLRMEAGKLGAIDSIKHIKRLRTSAPKLAKLQVRYTIMSTLMNHAFVRESAYRRKMNISFENKKPVLEEIKMDSSYYDFLQSLSYNDHNNMISYAYYEFIMRLRSIPPIEEEAQRASLATINEVIERASKDTSLKGLDELKKIRDNILYNKVTLLGTTEQAQPVALKKIINEDISLELDVMYLQSIGHRLDMNKDTLSIADLQKIKSAIKNKTLIADISTLNNNIRQKIQEARYSRSSQHRQLSDNLQADSTYAAIFDQYKGKVVFVDFWATWCVPCMQGMKRMAGLKEELAADSNIVFVYITDQTSPEKTYQTVIPGIKGAHYRVSNDQFNYFMSIFRIVGRPHYAIINKKGVPAHRHFLWAEPDQVKKKLQLLVSE